MWNDDFPRFMKAAMCPRRSRFHFGLPMVAFCIVACLPGQGHAQTRSSNPDTAQKEATHAMHASGTFEVKITPQTPDGKFEDATMGRMTIDKQFHGDLEGTSKGQMLTAMTDMKGSAGYVAIERVTATLHGRSGSFFLQHSATMTRGVPQLSVTVVPDSGTGQLVGLTGKMDIKIDAGKHSYQFEYTLP
jgi:hypothetical protein